MQACAEFAYRYTAVTNKESVNVEKDTASVGVFGSAQKMLTDVCCLFAILNRLDLKQVR